MKLQRHIHSMDALRHLLTYAEGKITLELLLMTVF